MEIMFSTLSHIINLTCLIFVTILSSRECWIQNVHILSSKCFNSVLVYVLHVYIASFTPHRLRAAAAPCDFLSRFGPTPRLWTVYTRIYTYTYIHIRRYTVDALARSYAHTPTAKPYFTHVVYITRDISSTHSRYHYATGTARHARRYSLWSRMGGYSCIRRYILKLDRPAWSFSYLDPTERRCD